MVFVQGFFWGGLGWFYVRFTFGSAVTFSTYVSSSLPIWRVRIYLTLVNFRYVLYGLVCFFLVVW